MYCCCITGCSNTSKTQSKFNDLKFYHFPRNSIHMPWLCEKRQKWINAIRKLSKHSNDWVPSKNATICNAHFIGNKKSENPTNPSYVPTIFPQEETNPQKFTKKLQRFQRNQRQTHQTEFVKIENSFQEFIAEGPSEELANQIPGFECDSIVSVDQRYDPYNFWNSTGVCTAEVQAIMADNDEKKHCVEDCEKKSYSVLLEHNYYKLQDDNSDEDDLSDSELVIGRPGEDYHEHPSFSRQTTVAARAKDAALKRRTSSYIVPGRLTKWH